MPYINGEDRHKVEPIVTQIKGVFNKEEVTPGIVNYLITHLLLEYLVKKGINYTTLNACVGILDNVKAEFYRRKVVPYEHQKMKENGEVYY